MAKLNNKNRINIEETSKKVYFIRSTPVNCLCNTKNRTSTLHRGKLVSIFFSFSVSDFSHALSKIHEQYADDLQSLVEDFRRKNVELRNER